MARLLGRVESRLVLSAAIIVSLLPFEWVPRLDAVFLLLFLVEFVLRSLLVFRGEARHSHGSRRGVTPTEAELQEDRGWEWPSTGALVLTFFDLLALLSFVPSLVGLEPDAGTRWLRLFRLSRMLLLLSYWAPLVRDVWSVLLRHERAKQVTLMGIIVLALSFAGAVVMDQMSVGHEELIDFDGDEVFGRDADGEALDPDDERFFVHLWWAFRQIQDPGNLLSSPDQTAAVIVSVALTIVGLFMVSFLIGLGTDVVREMMELSRLRPPGLHGHTIVVNIDPSTQQLLHELLRYSRKLLPVGALSLGWVQQLVRNSRRGLHGGRYLVVGRSPDPPDFMRQPELAHVGYRQVNVEDETFLYRTDVAESQRVVMLADLDAKDPDAETIQALLTITESLREADEDARRRASRSWLPVGRVRARLLIAEVLDESNIPAARAAIAGDGSGRDSVRTRAFVVPSERLIALFIACIAQREGVGRLLEELLTSHGHELYTLFFDLPGLGYQRGHRPDLSDDPSTIMGELIRRARSLPSHHRLVPVGVLMAGDGEDDIIVHINPEPDFSNLGDQRLDDAPEIERELDLDSPDTLGVPGMDLTTLAEAQLGQPQTPSGPNMSGMSGTFEQVSVAQPLVSSDSRTPRTLGATESRCIGFVAISNNFGRVRELADDLYERPRQRVPADLTKTRELGPFVCAPVTPLLRVLVSGFRSGTVSMIESLIQTEPSTQILLVLRDEVALEAAWDDFDAHTKLFERGLLRGHHGSFGSDETQRTLTWINPRHPDRSGDGPHVLLAVGDCSSSRQLTALPRGFGHVDSMDAVLLISSEHHGSDARTAKTLMKLETLTQSPRVVAEVLDVELARRLRRRGTGHEAERVRVYSIQELRAFFMFQAVVVPAFDMVYTELMGPWGQSFVRMTIEPAARPLSGTCSFEELANHLSLEGRVLVGVVLCDHSTSDGRHEHGPDCRTVLHVGESGGARGVDLSRLVDLWVIA
ncbi:ion transporter [Enhygromyxa salina]|uniref:ion transporter n=1 Tax=Enhygromyxa salina TaxID=215803 RepID=UPI0011B1DBB2|nr:ion transporter [Enhygromyxa salina]